MQVGRGEKMKKMLFFANLYPFFKKTTTKNERDVYAFVTVIIIIITNVHKMVSNYDGIGDYWTRTIRMPLPPPSQLWIPRLLT